MAWAFREINSVKHISGTALSIARHVELTTFTQSVPIYFH